MITVPDSSVYTEHALLVELGSTAIAIKPNDFISAVYLSHTESWTKSEAYKVAELWNGIGNDTSDILWYHITPTKHVEFFPLII